MNSIDPQPGVDAQYTKSIYALLSRSIVWSLLCYCVRARDHCWVFCDVTRDLLFTWYIVHEPSLGVIIFNAIPETAANTVVNPGEGPPYF